MTYPPCCNSDKKGYFFGPVKYLKFESLNLLLLYMEGQTIFMLGLTVSAFSSIGAIGAIGLGPPPNGGLQILHIWSFLQRSAHFDKAFYIIFRISTFY